MRETSSVTTGTVLGYVREVGGAGAVRAVLSAAALPETLEQLSDPGHWVSYASRIRLFEATAEHFGDPHIMYEVGRSSMRQSVAPSLLLALRTMASPEEIYRTMPATVAKYSTTSTMQLLESSCTSATFSFRLHEGYPHSRLDCLYAQGLIASIPEPFGLPPARVTHDACEADGAPACLYAVSWQAPGESEADEDAALAMENAALRRQLADLRSAAADLVGGDELADVLQRIVQRAAAAVVARGYLLVVRDADGLPVVHSHGLSEQEEQQTSADLLAGADLGRSALVVDIASARRQHGWLAALHWVAVAGDREALSGYARHAAAALDMVSALARSRRNEGRARALLELAQRLADTEREQDIAEVVVATMQAIVGCHSAGLLLWDEKAQLLRAASSATGSASARHLMQSLALAPADLPELAALLGDAHAQVHTRGEASAALNALMTAAEIEHMMVMPLLAGGRLLGALTGSWTTAAPSAHDTGSDVMLRLRGVADQAATALRNAQLASDVRHQADHDELTGLPNRRLFLRWLQDQRQLPAEAGTCTAVLFCDLDGFKGVNDSYGHATGDALLREVGRRLTAAVRQNDLVGRLSGDEFAALLPGVLGLREAKRVAERIVTSLAEPFLIDGQALQVTASVGLAVRESAEVGAGLLREADQAMYVAKQRGRNQVVCVPSPPLPSQDRRAAAPAS